MRGDKCTSPLLVSFLVTAFIGLSGLTAEDAVAGHTETSGDWFHGVCCPTDDAYAHVFNHNINEDFDLVELHVWATIPDYPTEPGCQLLLEIHSGFTSHQHTFAAPGSSHDGGSGFPPPGISERDVFGMHFVGTHEHRHNHHNFTGNTEDPNSNNICDEGLFQPNPNPIPVNERIRP